jgi:DNA-binding transcriptional MerR regulator
MKDGPLRSGALAERAGVSTDTLRFYERRGLLQRPPRDSNGYRRYPAEALDRVRLIRQALEAGFTVAELGRILTHRDRGGAPCREVFAIASARLSELEDRISELIDLRDRLQQTLVEWREQLERTPPGKRAGLLDGLALKRGQTRV